MPARHRPQRLPDPLLERRAADVERQVAAGAGRFDQPDDPRTGRPDPDQDYPDARDSVPR